VSDGLRVLGIFPHPDDESYSCGGTFARLADAGAIVQLLCATRGEGGQDHRAVPTSGPSLGDVRADELRASCAALGLVAPEFLDLPDGSLDSSDFPTVAGAIVAAIRRVRPQIVVTLGADGVYGHPDHLALHRLVIAAYGAAGGGDRFPAAEFGAGWMPRRLFCAAFPRGMFRPQYDRMTLSPEAAAMRGVDPGKLGVEPAEVVAAIDIRAVAGRKLASIDAHRSQLPQGDPYALFPDEIVRHLLTTELFTLAAGEHPAARLRSLDEGLELAAGS
jgi:N-acetyl-1-D-myo-inositol-2-amino-2-deoxy-alpha-D-glucopyranoside deacetylase